MNAILVVARKEISDGLRNRWILAITLIFAILASAIAWFGGAAVGAVGFSSIDNTIASLASLNVFLLPLIALLLAYDAVVGEDEDGTLLLLLTYPLSKAELLTGKLLGHSATLAIATLLGFGSAALTIAIGVENIDLGRLVSAFAQFIISAILLGTVFIAIAYLISSWVTEKSKAAGLALMIWFFFVLIYDMALLATLVASNGQIHGDLFPYLLLFNPTDIFRLLNLSGDAAGVLSIANEGGLGKATLLTAFALWIVMPMLAAYYRFNRRPV